MRTFNGRAAVLALAAIAAAGPGALAQPTIDWYTIDGGGGVSQGGGLRVEGTIGQPDAGESPSAIGGTFRLTGGFWSTSNCRADFNRDGTLNPTDIFNFLNAYFAGDIACDFTNTGTLEPADIFAYLTAYFAGCPFPF